MRDSRLKRQVIGAIVAIFVIATIAAPRAFANTVLDYDPTETINPVADNITRLNVNKLEKGSRDGVTGAHLAIYEKATGKLITEWITDGNAHEVARNAGDSNRGALDIDVVYILRELAAPDGYAKAKDVEFVIHSDNFNTTGEILSGGEDGNAESAEIRGSGPEQAFVISLFDEATVNLTEEEKRTRQRDLEEQDQREREKEQEKKEDKDKDKDTLPSSSNDSTTGSSTGSSTIRTSTSRSASGLTQTSDGTNYLPVMVLLIIGAGVIGLGVYRRRK